MNLITQNSCNMTWATSAILREALETGKMWIRSYNFSTSCGWHSAICLIRQQGTLSCFKVTGTRASLLQNWGQKHYLFVVLLGILQRLFVSCFRGGRGSLGKLALLPSGPSSPHGSSWKFSKAPAIKHLTSDFYYFHSATKSFSLCTWICKKAFFAGAIWRQTRALLHCWLRAAVV